MAVTDPRIFAQSVGLGNLPQLYATNIQAPDISPIQRAQQLSMQEQQFSTSLAMRQQEFKQRERAFELDELEKRLAFDDKLGAKFLSADMPTVHKIMDEIGLTQALEGPLKASEIVPLYKQFHQHERIQALTAKKSLTDNLLSYAKENKDVLGRNATAYRSQVLSTASNPDATVQDLASIDPRVFDYYDYRGLIEEQIAQNKDLTKNEKRQAIRNFITADPQAKRQLVLDGMVKEGDSTEDVVNRLSSIYAVSGKESDVEGGTASSAEFRGAYSPTGKSYISEANRQKAASIASGSGSTKEERLQPMESTKTFLFDNLRNNKEWIEDQTNKVDLDAPLARDSQGFLDLGGTAPSREELARADKSVERIDGNIYIKANMDAGTVYYNAGPDSQLIEDNAPSTPTEIIGEFKEVRRNYVDGALAREEREGQDPGTSVTTIDANDTELLDSVEQRFQTELGRYPSSEEIADIFGTNSPAYKIYQKANVIADAALRGDGSIARMNAGEGRQIEEVTPTNSVLGLPSNMSSLTATPPMGTVEGIEQATGTNLNELTTPPPTVRENINTTLDESEDDESIEVAPAVPTERPRTLGPEEDARPTPAPAIPVERAKELVEDEEDVPIIDEVIRSVGSMSQSTIDSIKEVTGVDLGGLIAQGPPAPAQTPPRAIELGSTSPGGGGGGGGWGEPEAPPPTPVERPRTLGPEEDARPEIAPAIPMEKAKELVENEEDVPIIDKLVEDVRSMSKSTIDSIKEVTGIDLGELTAQGPPTPTPEEETIERIVHTQLNSQDLGMDSISIRANNPMNLTDKGYAESHIVGSEQPVDGDARITKFDSVEAGIAAYYAKVNYHLNRGEKGWGYPEMNIKAWQQKFATSPVAWINFVDSADKLFGVKITEEDTLASSIEKLGGMGNFTEVMSRKENHILYPKLKKMGLFEKVTQDNYTKYLD